MALYFEWDPFKARTHERKHDALFEQDSSDEAGEMRWQALGLAEGVVLLLVAHTVREEGEAEAIRLISARRATRKERRRCDETRAQDAG